VVALAIVPIQAFAQGAGPCTRFTAGSTVSNPPALFSRNGKLTANLSYNTAINADGRTLHCFSTPDGTESPTFHVHLGETT
jgi:hypothetical protein